MDLDQSGTGSGRHCGLSSSGHVSKIGLGEHDFWDASSHVYTGAGIDGRVSINWRVCGVPNTFVIDRKSRIAFKQIGPVTLNRREETCPRVIERDCGDDAAA